ncbi:MAG: ATP-binding protein [Elusimicrobiota bacterium]|nr:ATP-binding protein [Elusimicrobiota bacterium]
MHTMCSFANDFHNLGGGYIVIGVEEKNGIPVLPPRGIPMSQIDKIQKEILNFGHHAIQPSYHPLTARYQINGKNIVVLWAPGGETRPYKAKARPLPACRAGRTAQNFPPNNPAGPPICKAEIFFLFLNYGHRKRRI